MQLHKLWSSRVACLSEIDELQRVPDERLFDVDIDLRVGRERRRVVHLEHLRLQLRREQHVEAEDLEARRARACSSLRNRAHVNKQPEDT